MFFILKIDFVVSKYTKLHIYKTELNRPKKCVWHMVLYEEIQIMSSFSVFKRNGINLVC